MLRQEGTACHASIQNKVTNPKILRVCWISMRLLCQHLTLLLTWSSSWRVGVGERMNEKQFWSLGFPGEAAPRDGKKVGGLEG